jgi:hypothetical protein
VDWANLSCHYISEQQTDLAAMHRLVPALPLYLELTFASGGRRTERRTVLDGTEEQAGYRLMTTAQFTTAAHLAYRQGCHGRLALQFCLLSESRSGPGDTAVRAAGETQGPRLGGAPAAALFSFAVGQPAQRAFGSSRGSGGWPPARPSTFALDLAAPEERLARVGPPAPGTLRTVGRAPGDRAVQRAGARIRE